MSKSTSSLAVGILRSPREINRAIWAAARILRWKDDGFKNAFPSGDRGPRTDGSIRINPRAKRSLRFPSAFATTVLRLLINVSGSVKKTLVVKRDFNRIIRKLNSGRAALFQTVQKRSAHYFKAEWIFYVKYASINEFKKKENIVEY